MKKSLFILLLAGLLLAACSSPATQAPAKPEGTKTAATWVSIKMTQSGGIAGVSRIITIMRDGHGTAVDERAGKNVAVAITGEQTAQLDSLILSAVKLPQVQLDLNCADCFIYTLDVAFPNRTGTAQVSDIQLAASGYEPLVALLRTLMDAALQ